MGQLSEHNGTKRNHTMTHFGALEAFVQAAETSSFKEAGRRIGLSSSAIGRTIAKLEQELGARLFHRSTRAISLTAEGEKFLFHCYRIFAEFDAAREELSAVTAEPKGRLRIGFPNLGTELMPHIVAFQKRYPEIELDLDFSDRLVNLVEEGFDAVMRIGSVDDSRLMMRRLSGFHHRLVAAPDYASLRGLPVSPDDLQTHLCLRYRYPSSGKLAPWPFLTNGELISPDLPTSSVSNNINSLLSMVENGLGIALLPDFMVHEKIKAKQLIPVLDEYILRWSRPFGQFCGLDKLYQVVVMPPF
ncbi:LysR family transcriptional regulator [Novacetimonas maltaceti]|uniref:LysR family transcriptional regulator n=2 Tax=Novacetimonas maltaceti TaxID=1203393 RepID=UPI001EF01E93|nr:LysR family transcriptional regulator [Novacetimonas maltaceti]